MESKDVITGSGLDGNVSVEKTEVMVAVDAPTISLPVSEPSSPQFDYPLLGSWKGDLADLLSRPVVVAEYGWTSGVGSLATVDIYDKLVSTVPIAYKLNNAYKFRPKAYKITIRANGNPYLYGMMWVAAVPDFATAYIANTPVFTTLTSFSCLPNFAMIDASGDSVVEITAPHIFNRELTLPAQVLGVMGLAFYEAATLATANTGGATPLVDILVMAQFVDPVIMEYTASHAFYATMKRSKPIKTVDDGESQGVISKPLAAVKRGMAEMAKVPFIGPLATSFSAAASLGEKVASWFGFSSPPLNLTYAPYLYRTISPLAICEGMDTSEQLSVHREVSTVIDPRLLGIDGADDMHLLSLARRWSACGTIAWPDTATDGTTLGTWLVTPLMGTIVGSSLAPTWLRFVSQPFQYYRGTIEVKLVIPASKFHSGRLQVVYDPIAIYYDSTNVSRNWIVDLSDTTVLEFTVPYTYFYPAFPIWSNNDFWVQNPLNSWGSLGFVVRSKLKSGLSASTLTILMFVRAGPDAEWYQPSMLACNSRVDATHLNVVGRFPTGTTTTPSAYQYSWFGTSGTTTEPLATIEPSTPGYMSQFVWSDRVTSIRELLKRFVYTETYSPSDYTKTSYQGVRDEVGQPYFATNALSQTTYTVDSQNQFNFFNYFMPAFLYHRGGFRHKFVGSALDNAVVFKDVTNRTTDFMLGASNTKGGVWRASVTMQGCALCKAPQQSIEVLNPWSDVVFARRNDAVVNQYDMSSGVVLMWPITAAAPPGVDHYVSSADDMTFFYPICPPIQYKYTNNPA